MILKARTFTTVDILLTPTLSTAKDSHKDFCYDSPTADIGKIHRAQ